MASQWRDFQNVGKCIAIDKNAILHRNSCSANCILNIGHGFVWNNRITLRYWIYVCDLAIVSSFFLNIFGAVFVSAIDKDTYSKTHKLDAPKSSVCNKILSHNLFIRDSTLAHNLLYGTQFWILLKGTLIVDICLYLPCFCSLKRKCRNFGIWSSQIWSFFRKFWDNFEQKAKVPYCVSRKRQHWWRCWKFET